MTIDLRSINIGSRNTIKIGINVVETGNYKTPSFEHMKINRHGFTQDVVVDTKSHGGLDQAVYIYSHGKPIQRLFNCMIFGIRENAIQSYLEWVSKRRLQKEHALRSSSGWRKQSATLPLSDLDLADK